VASSRSWGSMPSLLSGFITIVGGVHIKTEVIMQDCGEGMYKSKTLMGIKRGELLNVDNRVMLLFLFVYYTS
jgi:hypothetical protein